MLTQLDAFALRHNRPISENSDSIPKISVPVSHPGHTVINSFDNIN
ncbi:hypothetical protein FHS10_002164 [Mucilaginibacter dorajii]|nr:hypothetical protein [Mucilaginibacter dorajii]